MNDAPPEPRTGHKPRSLGRRLAMQYLFAADLNGFDKAEPLELFLETQRLAEIDAGAKAPPLADAPHWRAATAFAADLVGLVLAGREALDVRLSACSEHWDFERLATVERNILRVAAAELARGEVDAPVAIDEAVRLAKLFGGKDSGAFVNGVLDALRRGEGRA